MKKIKEGFMILPWYMKGLVIFQTIAVILGIISLDASAIIISSTSLSFTIFIILSNLELSKQVKRDKEFSELFKECMLLRLENHHLKQVITSGQKQVNSNE